MAKFEENFQGKNESILCPLCSKHIDNQKMSFEKLPSLEVKHQNIRQLWSNFQPFSPAGISEYTCTNRQVPGR